MLGSIELLLERLGEGWGSGFGFFLKKIMATRIFPLRGIVKICGVFPVADCRVFCNNIVRSYGAM
ncbi:MAG: hypothetical protein HY861_02155 [Chlamydiia bacterium]|nr:hypothetical protein [Chlamydiia bacterium]